MDDDFMKELTERVIKEAKEAERTMAERRVAVDENVDGKFCSTVAVHDEIDKPYETAIKHPDYKRVMDAPMVVEAYDTKEEAAEGHKKWWKKVQNDDLPNPIVEVPNSYLAKMCNPADLTHYKQEKKHFEFNSFFKG